MFTTTFLKAATERAVRAAAAALISLWVVGDQALDALHVDWSEALGVALGAALVSFLLSLVGGTANTPGPSLLGTETTTDAKHRADEKPDAPFTGGH